MPWPELQSFLSLLSAPALQLRDPRKHEFSVDMNCEGCAEAVSRVLNKLGGVKFNIDLPNRKVYIESDHSTDTLLTTLTKTGKAVLYIGPK
ncbi:copper transport protein ATOX1 isoform X2 [Mesocricetus auratus]|uniref:Copper transport protein ATOX1 n=1 Tax=Mesocricetus auratus TaxID=10036 RepID=A0A1U8BH98_MESAU|nr:copper transport protein ATOX1 isoform X2 [Mesocricetus auratus]